MIGALSALEGVRRGGPPTRDQLLAAWSARRDMLRSASDRAQASTRRWYAAAMRGWWGVVLFLSACDERVAQDIDAAVTPDAFDCSANAMDSLAGYAIVVPELVFYGTAHFDAEPNAYMESSCFLRRNLAPYAYVRTSDCTSRLRMIVGFENGSPIVYEMIWTAATSGTCSASIEGGAATACTFSLAGC